MFAMPSLLWGNDDEEKEIRERWDGDDMMCFALRLLFK